MPFVTVKLPLLLQLLMCGKYEVGHLRDYEITDGLEGLK
jgi:hypothetical protein